MSEDPHVAAHLRHMRLEGKSELTVYNQGLTLARLQAALPCPLLDATPEQLYEWRAGLGVLGDGTVRVYVSRIRTFYEWALDADLIAVSPARKVPCPRAPDNVPRPIDHEDLARAVESAEQPVRLWHILASMCGMRCKEIALLRADRIRLAGDNPHIIIAADATKGNRGREIPLAPFVVAEIRAAALPVTGLVFRRDDGTAYRPSNVSKMTNEHLHSLGIADTFHSLRHWFCSEGYERSGGDVMWMARLMGHKNIQTTAGYARLTGARGAEIVGQLPLPLRDAG